jgi:hypothetical protein
LRLRKLDPAAFWVFYRRNNDRGNWGRNLNMNLGKHHDDSQMAKDYKIQGKDSMI